MDPLSENRPRPGLDVEIVKRAGDLTVFTVLPRRWVVERTFALITHRRARDYERLPASTLPWSSGPPSSR